MKAKSSAHYQREFRRRLREQGLVKKEVWIRPENAKRLSELEKMLREPEENIRPVGEMMMTNMTSTWTTTTLYRALTASELCSDNQATIELVEGVNPALHIIMHEFGDLPVFLTVSGEQIVVESVLWSVNEVLDVDKFNKVVLRTHKYFPLSTISLDTLSEGEDFYQMFGALSSSSILPNIIFEIEVLASNVIQATDAYGEFLSSRSVAVGGRQ